MYAMAVEFPEVVGQPGRLHELEHRLILTERAMHRMRGVVAAFGVVLTLLHLAISYFSMKHN
jgi:hypothetical protein